MGWQMILLKLFLEFFKTGLFSVGGGYATMPFLYEISNHYGWYTLKELGDIVAISVITPGPVGINMATYAGFKTTGITGSIVATLALVLPSYFIIILVSKLLKRFEDNFYVRSTLYSLKPAGCGMLAAVGLHLAKTNISDIPSFIIFAVLFYMTLDFKRNPLYFFLAGGIIGIIVKMYF